MKRHTRIQRLAARSAATVVTTVAVAAGMQFAITGAQAAITGAPATANPYSPA